MEEINTIIIADSEIRRAGISALLNGIDRVNVEGSFNISQGIVEIPRLQSDLILIDWDDFYTSQLHELLEVLDMEIKIILLVDQLTDEIIIPNTRIKAVLHKDIDRLEFQKVLDHIDTDLVLIHQDFLKTESLGVALQVDNNPATTTKLSKRELEVLEWLAFGSTNKEIAEQLEISEHTIKFHLNSIFNKLNVSSRTEAVSQGIRLGLLML